MVSGRYKFTWQPSFDGIVQAAAQFLVHRLCLCESHLFHCLVESLPATNLAICEEVFDICILHLVFSLSLDFVCIACSNEQLCPIVMTPSALGPAVGWDGDRAVWVVYHLAHVTWNVATGTQALYCCRMFFPTQCCGQ